MLFLIGLLIANLWSILALHRALSSLPAPALESRDKTSALSPSTKQNTTTTDIERDRFLAALHELLIEHGSNREWEAQKGLLLARYQRLVQTHEDLHVRDGSERDQITIAAISVLAERSAGRIENEVRKALSNKGFSDRVIQAACEHVREQFIGHSNHER